MIKMMHRIADLGGNPSHLITTGDLADLAPQSGEAGEKFFFLNRHLEFLAQLGYLSLGGLTVQFGERMIRMTAMGQIFVQPELAEFANRSLLPDIIDVLEQQIQTLTYPEPEKSGLIFRLREAVAKQTPDIIVKILIEIGSRLAKQQ